MASAETTIHAALLSTGYTQEQADEFIAQFTSELAEDLFTQTVPPSSYGSPVRYGYYAAIQRLDRTGQHFYWEHV